MSVLLGQRYELLDQLGKGGMGEVYAARDHLSGDFVALKRVLVEPNFLQFNSRNETAELRITLTREFRTLASLRHPHIISVLDYGFDSQNQPFYTMEYLQDTQPLLRVSGTLDDEGKINLIIQLLQGLDYLHHRGLLHRDLKPANVLVVNNNIKIIDFGLAIEPEQAQDPVGTLTFMAPELFEGENASVASDLYAVGIIIYVMFANCYPFDGHKMAQGLIEDILNLTPDFEPIPELLRPILEKLLAKKANNRFGSAHDTIVAISEVTRQAVPKETLAIRESYLQASRFIGRSDELNTLTNALNNAIHDHGSAWLIGGESGVGKSRLLQELRVKALVQGVTVISALGEDGTVAGNTFWANPLRRLLLSVTVDDFEASILKAIVPDISNILKRPVDDAPELSGEAFKLRLELVIVSIFERQQTPVLLILEDIHWALDSLEPLQLLTSVIEHLPLLIVGTYRNDEQPNLPNEIPNTKTIILKRFDNLEVQNICRSMLKQHTVDDEVINLIEKETEGNAFFIVEVIRALAEDAGSLGDIGQVTLPANVFAQGIQSLVIRRLNKIPAWGQKLLQVAAISGRQLSRPLLEQALADWVEDSSNHSLEEWLTLCSDVAVLDVQDEVWRFAHDKLREGLLGDLKLSEKRKLHGYVGTLKETIFSENIAPYLADIALHFQQARNEVKEGHYMYLAGQQAAKQYANADAIRFLSRALELCPATQAEHYFEILKHREQVYNHQSLRDLQRLDLNDMTKIAETLNNQVMLAWVYSRWAEFYEQIDELDQVEIVAQKAIELAHLIDRADIAGMAHFWWARVLRKRADFGEAQKHNAEMLAIARRLGDRNLETEALRHTGYTAVQAGQFKFAHPYLVEAIEVAEAIGNRRAKSLGQMVLGELILYTPYFHQAMYLFKDALEFLELIGDRWGQTWAGLGLLASYELIGDYWNAMLIGEKTVTLCKQLHDNDKLFEASSFLCEAYQALGDYETARDYANFVLGFAKTNEKFLARMSAMSTLGLIAYEQENYSDSISFFKDAVSVSEQAGMNVFIMHSLTYLGHAYWQNGDYVRAEEVWDRAVNQVVLEQQNRGIFRGYCGLAMVANRKEQPNETLKHIEPFINYLKESTTKTGSIQIDTYSNTFLVLRSLGDVRATYVLEEGYAFLQEMANHIPDHAARERFLKIRTHQRFLDLWEDFHKTKDDTTESPV